MPSSSQQPGFPPTRIRATRLACAGLLVHLCVLLAGCVQGPAINEPARLGPFYQPRKFAGDAMLPGTLHRVLVLPVCAGTVAGPV